MWFFRILFGAPPYRRGGRFKATLSPINQGLQLIYLGRFSSLPSLLYMLGINGLDFYHHVGIIGYVYSIYIQFFSLFFFVMECAISPV